MNILKIILGVLLLGLVASYRMYPGLGLATLNLPFPVLLIIGILAIAAGAKLIYDGINNR